MVWQLLAKPLLGVAADTVRGFVETKKAKAELKVTEIKAATKLKEDQIAGKIKWEASAVDQMKGSWKDELILICLLAPATLVFFPGMTEHIEKGFIALQSLPDYYKHLLYIACSASFCIKGAKGAVGLFKKKKLMDAIYLAEKLYRVIRTRQTQLTEIIINNQVKDWNDYQNHLGQLDTLNYIEQELSDLLKKQEQND